MKKVLLITYYWPPSGGAGVQRVLKLVKYFRDFGWEPIVYAPENPAYPILDESLLADIPTGQEVIKGPIWEPYDFYKKFTGQGKKERVYSGFLSEDKKPSFTQKLSVWIRGNFFIPDARRFWIKPSVNRLSEYLKNHPVDAILSSGPPHTVHLIAKGVKENTGIPWVADFRDPWTNIDFYDQLMLTRWADNRHHKLEKSVVTAADKLVTVSWVWAKEFEALGAKTVEVITNGFDREDMAAAKEDSALPLEGKFICSHIGYLNRDRNNATLWQAFGEICKEIPAIKKDLVLRFIGKTDAITFTQLAQNGLTDNVEKIDYIPHNEVLKYTRSTPVLLLLVNNVPNVMGHIPGKTYEYIGSRRPVLAVGPEDADFARVIRETNSGEVCGFDDLEKMKRVIFQYYRRYKKGELNNPEGTVERFTRREATRQMATLLNQLTQ
ncbi:MAG: glycosyltransferase [Bacteroidia bacterium]|nr:glycosyltransferase [Bacteroidia bacterium]